MEILFNAMMDAVGNGDDGGMVRDGWKRVGHAMSHVSYNQNPQMEGLAGLYNILQLLQYTIHNH